MRSTSLPMDTFGMEAVADYARTRRVSTADVVHDAALYYLAERGCEGQSWRVPRFLREGEDVPAAPEQLEVDIDDDTWAALEQEARRQGVPPDLLLQHAVMYFLAKT